MASLLGIKVQPSEDFVAIELRALLVFLKSPMSIEVSGLTKIYGKQKAIDQVSFKVSQGEIVGLLGPNGAGKSTTMKILTCFISQSSGTAKVCGLDVLEESLKVRRLTGYLPEQNPLYKDMYIKEYLLHVARVHKISKPKARLAEMIEKVGLGVEQHKKIGQLSKGYRQRVGLAQALIHDPKVLILDEPTSGLDPNQLVDIRKLILEIGREKTVILSTHIMQEVEAICDRVLIINRGKLVADDKVADLQAKNKQGEIIEVEFDKEITRSALSKLDGVQSVTAHENGRWRLTTLEDSNELKKRIFDFAVAANLKVVSMNTVEEGLEEVFRRYTS